MYGLFRLTVGHIAYDGIYADNTHNSYGVHHSSGKHGDAGRRGKQSDRHGFYLIYEYCKT